MYDVVPSAVTVTVSSEDAEREPWTPALTEGAVADTAPGYLKGAQAGLFGAALLAVWFFLLDVARGQPLSTPTTLGVALLGGGSGPESPATLPASILLTLMFTIAHGLAFLTIGVAAAFVLRTVRRAVHPALAALLLFVLLGMGFFGFAIPFAGSALAGRSIRDVLVGNAVATVAMTIFLMRRRA